MEKAKMNRQEKKTKEYASTVTRIQVNGGKQYPRDVFLGTLFQAYPDPYKNINIITLPASLGIMERRAGYMFGNRIHIETAELSPEIFLEYVVNHRPEGFDIRCTHCSFEDLLRHKVVYNNHGIGLVNRLWGARKPGSVDGTWDDSCCAYNGQSSRNFAVVNEVMPVGVAFVTASVRGNGTGGYQGVSGKILRDVPKVFKGSRCIHQSFYRGAGGSAMVLIGFERGLPHLRPAIMDFRPTKVRKKLRLSDIRNDIINPSLTIDQVS